MITLVNISPRGYDYSKKPQFSVEPLGIGYLASNLPQEIKVRLFDTYIQKLSIKDLALKIRELNPKLIGLSFSQFALEEVAELCRELDGLEGHIVAGGIFPTLAGNSLFDHFPIDSVIFGEGEETFALMAKALLENTDLPQNENISYRAKKNEQAVPGVVDVNRINNPDRTLTPLTLGHNPIGISSSRGCPWSNCNFCTSAAISNKINGKRWRGRQIDNVAREVLELKKRFNHDSFSFVDDCFFGPNENWQNRGYELAEALKKREVVYSLNCRSEHVDPTLIQRLMTSGLRGLYIGIESSTNRGLQRLKKGNTIEEVNKAIEVCDNLGLDLRIGFMPFHPEADLEEVMANLEFLRGLNTYQRGIYSNVTIPLYGTKFQQSLGLSDGDYSIPEPKFVDPRVERLFTKIRDYSRKGESLERKNMERYVREVIAESKSL